MVQSYELMRVKLVAEHEKEVQKVRMQGESALLERDSEVKKLRIANKQMADEVKVC